MTWVAGPLVAHPMPPNFQEDIGAPSFEHALLMYYGLSEGTRNGYNSAVNMYKKWCWLVGCNPFPVTKITVQAWVVARVTHNGSKAFTGQVTPTTMESYIVALRSYHTDRGEDPPCL